MATSGLARLLIVRHGATANNAEGRFTGQSAAPLSALGRAQVEALAGRLADAQIDSIVSSDLPRARETALVIAAGRSCEITLDHDLREVSLGAWEGLSPDQARARDPETFRRWRDDPMRCAPPGGETIEQLAERVRRAWDRWATQPAGATTLWVTHGGIMSVVLSHTLGLSLDERGRFRRDNASITEIVREHDALVIARVNDTAHLEGLGAAGLAETRQML